LAAGCGQNQDGTVSGTVTFQGKPVPLSAIVFDCKDGAEPKRATVTDGKYTLERVPAGTTKIYFQNPSAKWMLGPREGSTDKSAKQFKLPAKFCDPKSSGLEFTVSPGNQTKDFDLQP
jgi:hypothetical protein